MKTHKLTLKREVLAEIDTAGLAKIGGGDGITFTCLSCMTYISCFPTMCITRTTGPHPDTLVEC